MVAYAADALLAEAAEHMPDAVDLRRRIHRHPELFSQAHLTQGVDQSAWRWTVDTPEDWAMVEAVYQALYRPGEPFTREAVAGFLATHPKTAQLNGALG